MKKKMIKWWYEMCINKLFINYSNLFTPSTWWVEWAYSEYKCVNFVDHFLIIPDYKNSDSHNYST